MELVLIGEGGHGKVIQDLLRKNTRYTLQGVLDDKYKHLALESGLYKGPVYAAQSLLARWKDPAFVVAIGDNKTRKSIVWRLGLSSASYAPLIHESAIVSPSARIGAGTVIMAHAVVQADAEIGEHAIVNTGAIVEHDCRIGDFAHVAPRAVLAGAARVREGALIGAGAVLIPGVEAGEWSIVGAGSTVIGNIPANRTAVGSPARFVIPLNERMSAKW